MTMATPQAFCPSRGHTRSTRRRRTLRWFKLHQRSFSIAMKKTRFTARYALRSHTLRPALPYHAFCRQSPYWRWKAVNGSKGLDQKHILVLDEIRPIAWWIWHRAKPFSFWTTTTRRKKSSKVNLRALWRWRRNLLESETISRKNEPDRNANADKR